MKCYGIESNGLKRAKYARTPKMLRSMGGNPPTLVYFKANASAEELMRGAVDVMQRAVQDYLAAPESED